MPGFSTDGKWEFLFLGMAIPLIIAFICINTTLAGLIPDGPGITHPLHCLFTLHGGLEIVEWALTWYPLTYLYWSEKPKRICWWFTLCCFGTLVTIGTWCAFAWMYQLP